MKLEIWTQYGPLNSEPIFKAFIKSVQDAGDEVVLNKHSDADVAVIWSDESAATAEPLLRRGRG